MSEAQELLHFIRATWNHSHVYYFNYLVPADLLAANPTWRLRKKKYIPQLKRQKAEGLFCSGFRFLSMTFKWV